MPHARVFGKVNVQGDRGVAPLVEALNSLPGVRTSGSCGTTRVPREVPCNDGQGQAAEVVIPSDPAEARRIQDEIEQALRCLPGGNDRDLFCIQLALEEALVNAIKHGNQLDRDKQVRIAYRIRADLFEVAITDEGAGFDPGEVPDPTAVESLERPCGRGLMLMRHYMTHVAFNERGNSVSMSKVLRDG
jgi:serine/threonine-protein kinase RsbW